MAAAWAMPVMMSESVLASNALVIVLNATGNIGSPWKNELGVRQITQTYLHALYENRI